MNSAWNRAAWIGAAFLAGSAALALAQAPSLRPAGSAKGSLTSSADSSVRSAAPEPPGGLRDSFYDRDLSPGTRSGNSIFVEHALVLSLEAVKVPARDAGPIKGSFLVEKGQEVKQGDLVGHIDDTDPQTRKKIAERERDAAKKQAESEAQLQAAKDGASVTKENFEANDKLKKEQPGTVSDFEWRRSWYEYQRALAQIKVAQEEKDIAYLTQLAKEAQIEAADNEIERRKIVSPIDGVVTDIYKDRGEWCQPGDAVMEVVRMDQLEVVGFVYADDASPAQVRGKPVKVVIHLAGGGKHEAPGTIRFASPVLEGSGRIRQFRVAARIENKRITDESGKPDWLIQPGTEAEMVIDVSPLAAKPLVSPKTTSGPGTPRAAAPGKAVEANKPVVSDAAGAATGGKATKDAAGSEAPGEKPSTASGISGTKPGGLPSKTQPADAKDHSSGLPPKPAAGSTEEIQPKLKLPAEKKDGAGETTDKSIGDGNPSHNKTGDPTKENSTRKRAL